MKILVMAVKVASVEACCFHTWRGHFQMKLFLTALDFALSKAESSGQ